MAVAVAGDLRDVRNNVDSRDGQSAVSQMFAEADSKCRAGLDRVGMEGSGAASDEDSAKDASGCSTPERSGS